MPKDRDDPDARATTRPNDTLTDPVLVAPEPIGPVSRDLEDRYVVGATLGEGGMGEILLARDRRIGRDIALKLMHPRFRATPDAAARFTREARVQGQLEHPAIVPVYDLATTAQGETYFTMRRVRGRTLAEIIDSIRVGDPSAARLTLRRLLTSFVQVCLAVDFAHAHGVIHRDLKPENVMLGDFGEVYVLDWGIARAGADLDPTVSIDLNADPAEMFKNETRRIEVGPRRSRETADGEVLGTAGFMSPEQARGAHSMVDERSDVYSLGALLFEIVALEPLHRGGTVEALLRSTIVGTDARPSARRPSVNVPPEIDAICVRACALDAGERYPSARDLATDIERYLDGDRDQRHRAELADAHAADAVNASERALSPSGTLEDRSRAMQSAGRALALDPSHATAMRVILRLLSEPVRQVPRDVERELDADVHESVRGFASFGALAYLAWLSFAPITATLGVREWPTFLCIPIVLAAAAAVSFVGSRVPRWASRALIAAFGLGTLATILLGRLWGAFIFGPMMLLLHTSLYCMLPGRGRRLALVAAGVFALFAPELAVSAGIASPQTILDGTIRVLPRLTDLPPSMTRWYILLCSALIVVVGGLGFGRLRDALRAAERRLRTQSWHLRQLVPAETMDPPVRTDGAA